MTTRCPASTPHVFMIEALSTVSMDARIWEKWNCAASKPRRAGSSGESPISVPVT